MSDWSKIPAATLQPVLDRSGDPATVAWAHEGKGRLSDLADPMLGIAAAAALGNAAALQSVAAPKDLKKAAAAALHRLRSSGVKVEAPKPQASFQLAAEGNVPAPRAFVALPDGSGEVEFVLTVSDPAESCAIGLRAVSHSIITDSGHSHLSRTDLRNTWAEVQKNGLIEIPFSAGLHWADRLIGSTHAFRHFLEHVPAATIAAARANPPRPLAAIEEAPEQIGKDWALSSALWDLTVLEPIVHAIFSDPVDEGTSPDARYEAAVNQIAAGIVRDDNRAKIVDSLRFLAEIFALTGRDASANHINAWALGVEAGGSLEGAPPLRQSAALALARESQAQMQAFVQSQMGMQDE